MPAATTLPERYLAAVEQAAGAAAKALRTRGDLSRSGSAEAISAAAALLPAALARHRRRRKGAIEAVLEVLAKFGRPEALATPRLLQEPDPRLGEPNPRLGGLLGDDGVRLAAWLAARTHDPAPVGGRALAAVAPMLLAALAQAGSADELAAWLDERADGELAEPATLVADSGFPAEAFRRIRTRGFPWWSRMLP
ncbi:MAG: hypothetical protein ACKOSS_00345 [Planctomycetia bacterium]